MGSGVQAGANGRVRVSADDRIFLDSGETFDLDDIRHVCRALTTPAWLIVTRTGRHFFVNADAGRDVVDALAERSVVDIGRK